MLAVQQQKFRGEFGDHYLNQNSYFAAAHESLAIPLRGLVLRRGEVAWDPAAQFLNTGWSGAGTLQQDLAKFDGLRALCAASIREESRNLIKSHGQL